MNKSEVNAGDWENDLTGGEMRIYVGIDMAKDKFDYCAMDRENNVLCAGSNCSNNRNEFQKFSETVNALRMTGVMLSIGMESTGIYHLPLYNYLSTEGYRVRILNGLEVRGMKKARATVIRSKNVRSTADNGFKQDYCRSAMTIGATKTV